MRTARPGDELHRRLARNLRTLARARRIPLSHVADRAGVGRTQLWDLMAGRRSVTLRWLERVAGALGVDPAELLAPERGRDRS